MNHLFTPYGTVVNGDSLSQTVVNKSPKCQLIIADPPYGGIVDEKWDKMSDVTTFVDGMLNWTRMWADRLEDGCGMFVWGGIGRPYMRPFFQYLARAEAETCLQIANLITWGKRRAYGIQHNYLFCREECVYLFKGEDIKKPKTFNIPLLEEKRGYAGFNKKYPAKSDFLRRSNVWTDIPELFKGKTHPCEKPVKLYETIILAHTNGGDVVIDPFAGSGVCAEACVRTGRRFHVIEKDEKYFFCINKRLAKV